MLRTVVAHTDGWLLIHNSRCDLEEVDTSSERVAESEGSQSNPSSDYIDWQPQTGRANQVLMPGRVLNGSERNV
jgi:hypothetical protein